MIISRTPVRISFFGGGSDYPPYYLRHKGAVLGTTINKYIHVSVNRLSNFFDHKIRIGYSKTELINKLSEIEHPSIRECLKFHNICSNLDIHIFSDLPAKSGLGSSSSFTVGFLNALYSLQGKKIPKQKLAEEACHIEQNLIPENVGSQDQFHAAFGGLNIMEFSADQISVRPVVVSLENRKVLETHMMVFFTGMTRFASQVVKEQIDKTATQVNDNYLKKMVDLVYEAEELIANCSANQLAAEFGKLLHQSWEYKKQLSSQISNSFIDESYLKALNAGAYGGKLCGAGSGGFLALFVPPEKKDSVRQALQGLLEVTVQFENEGTSIIYMKD